MPENIKLKNATQSSVQEGGRLPCHGSAIPRPVFPCGVDCCREEVSYLADQLFWYAPYNDWVCENCWDDLPRIGGEDDGEVPERGISLHAHILESSLSAADLLQNALITHEMGPKPQ